MKPDDKGLQDYDRNWRVEVRQTLRLPPYVHHLSIAKSARKIVVTCLPHVCYILVTRHTLPTSFAGQGSPLKLKFFPEIGASVIAQLSQDPGQASPLIIEFNTMIAFDRCRKVISEITPWLIFNSKIIGDTLIREWVFRRRF